MKIPRYKPRFSFWPIVPIRWRSRSHGRGQARLAWTIYLFGLLPIARLPRKGK